MYLHHSHRHLHAIAGLPLLISMNKYLCLTPASKFFDTFGYETKDG